MHVPTTLTMQLLSDATFGSGRGTAGEVDAEVEHDRYGLPVVRGKVLKGLLLDSWLSMSHAFPGLHAGAARLFGSEGTQVNAGSLRITNAQLGEELRRAAAWACEREVDPIPVRRILQSLTTIRRQTALSRSTGSAETGSLRTSRVMVRGMSLTASLQWMSLPSPEELRVLALSVLATRHAGLGRNRGRGRLALLLNNDAAQTRSWAFPMPAAMTTGPAILDFDDAYVTAPTNNVGAVTVTRFYRLQLHLASPVLAGIAEGDPNSVRTGLTIPGGILRGAISDYLPQAAIPDMILSGNVSYLNAYPVSRSTAGAGFRALPAAVPLHANKYLPKVEFYDLSMEETWDHDLPPLVPLSQHLAYPAGQGIPVAVATTLRIHHRRDRRFGRSRPETGAIFAYESLDEGQVFETLLCLRGNGADVQEANKDLQRRLGNIRHALGRANRQHGGLVFGRAKRSQYGGQARCHLFESPLQRELQHSHRDLLWPEKESISSDGEFLILLTSDYIGRHAESGQVDPAYFEVELTRCMAQPGCRVTGRFLRWGMAGGYNRRWALPLPLVKTLAAGSVYRCKVESEILPQDWLALEQQPLGERTAEGFGRFAILKLGLPTSIDFSTLPRRDTPPDMISEPDLQWMQERLIHSALTSELYLRASELAATYQGKLTTSLIARLRAPFRQGYVTGVNILKNWLETGALRAMAREKMAASRLTDDSISENGEAIPFQDWLQRLVTAPAAYRYHAEIVATSAGKWRLSKREYQPDMSAAEMSGRLVDGLLALIQQKITRT